MVDIWAGIDAGKRERHCVVIDEDGTHPLPGKLPVQTSPDPATSQTGGEPATSGTDLVPWGFDE